MSHDLHHL
jgi:chromosome segregation ATPase